MSNHRDDLDGEHKAPHWPNPLDTMSASERRTLQDNREMIANTLDALGGLESLGKSKFMQEIAPSMVASASGTRELGSDFIRSGAEPCTGERVTFDRTNHQYESLSNVRATSGPTIAVARHSFKDHEIRELVNQLKHEADMHHPHPLRRDVISRVVHEFLRGEFK